MFVTHYSCTYISRSSLARGSIMNASSSSSILTGSAGNDTCFFSTGSVYLPSDLRFLMWGGEISSIPTSSASVKFQTDDYFSTTIKRFHKMKNKFTKLLGHDS